eukprot:TRINITY_DN2189_c0_g1_i1.p1 TRINITY_DN2189_c0_g1~~TRINITY_DN2189_c0_g1_i1.p1  ORF type:complete len:106 (+),score=39.31 TRINITY_DN2189_c0_g1_i1:61-378(+)
MSSVEETLTRIQQHPGVEGFIIVNNEGNVIRRSKSFEDENKLEMVNLYADLLKDFSAQSKSAVRDLDPTNELSFIRLRSEKHEIMIAPEQQYTIIVFQDPSQQAM